MRLNTKEQRLAYRKVFIPDNAVKDPRSGPAAEAYTYEQAGAMYAMGFWGSAGKPTFHYRYNTEERRTEKLDDFFEGVESSRKFKAEMKATKLAAPRGVEVGDVLRMTWGYDQTNNDYFECTKVLGKNKIEMREIGSDYEETGWLSGQRTPVPGSFLEDGFWGKGKVMTKIARNGSVSMTSYASASVMKPESIANGKAVYGSSYDSSYA